MTVNLFGDLKELFPSACTLLIFLYKRIFEHLYPFTVLQEFTGVPVSCV